MGAGAGSAGYLAVRSGMRIGILSQWYAPEPGPASLPEVLARQLAARGHEVSVVTGFPNYPTGKLFAGYRMRRRLDEGENDGVRIRRVALYPSHNDSISGRFANYGSFALSAALNGLDVLRRTDAFWVYNSPATIGLPSALATAAGGPPHLMHVMDLWPDTIRFSGLADQRTYRAAELILRDWCRWTYRRAAAIACISRTVTAVLEARGVPAEKLHYVPVWTDEELYYPRDRPDRLAQEIGVGDRFTLMYAGNLGDAQGLDGLLEVCARLSDLDDFHCLIAGSGVAEPRLRRKAQELGLTNTTFLGRLPVSEMGRLIALGDLHVLSLNEDPLSAMTIPSKLPSILASARAILASAAGEPSRIVNDAGAGWTVQPGDADEFEHAVRQAHGEGRSGLASRGRAGRAYYERHFALRAGVDAVETILKEIANSSNSHARLLQSAGDPTIPQPWD